MPHIRKLPSSVYNKIAAGEVVQRPASVVKELVENAVDAGADRIAVEIVKGGIDLIAVTDNGCGIAKEELETAFLPHATSKISSENDLESILTLGFRGEALASVAAVARVTMISKPAAQEVAGKIELDGERRELGDCAGNNGTAITVEHLFYHTPARLKFLKSPRSEEGEVSSLMARLILANPRIAFRYTANGKEVYHSEGRGPEDAVCAVYGAETLTNCLPVSYDNHGVKLSGYIGRGGYAKQNRSFQTLILNGRCVVNPSLATAVAQGYGEFLMKRQYPFFVLRLEVPPAEVDVNVHPAKSEIRFADPNKIFSIVYKTVFSALRRVENAAQTNAFSADLFRRHRPEARRQSEFSVVFEPVETESPPAARRAGTAPLAKEEAAAAEVVAVEPIAAKEVVSAVGNVPVREEAAALNEPVFQREVAAAAPPARKTAPAETTARGPEPTKPGAEPPSTVLPSQPGKGAGLLPDTAPGPTRPEEAERKNEEPQSTKPSEFYRLDLPEYDEQFHDPEVDISRLRVVGTLFQTYIIAEYADEFYFIDQHAAHERILYDKFRDSVTNVGVQPLLVPYILTLSPQEDAIFEEMIDKMRALNFDIEPFGMGSYKVAGIPLLLTGMDIDAFFGDLTANMREFEHLTDFAPVRDRIAKRACRSAVKAGDPLSLAEIQKLLTAMHQTTLRCPHGRPIIVKYRKAEIEKWFKRIV